jgi:sulfite reductase (NADPH) flavoprotein alpha-component
MNQSQLKQVPFIPDSAPFTPEQRAWLNGFFAGLFSNQQIATAQKNAESAPTSIPISIYYGSETGNSEALAKRLAKEAKKRGLDATCAGLDKLRLGDLAGQRQVLIMTSTYGDGDPPSNAQGFHTELMVADEQTSLAHLRFSVLALGDTNYARFCQCGKDIDHKLEKLGAQRFYERVDCDVDFEVPAQGWIDGVLGVLLADSPAPVAPVGRLAQAPAAEPAAQQALAPPAPAPKAFGAQPGALHSPSTPAAVQTEAPGWSRKNPYPAALKLCRKLNTKGSEKDVRHIEISLADSGIAYTPGDALGVWPKNCPELVDRLILTLKCDGEEAICDPDGNETSLRHALLCRYDISRVTLPLMEEVARRTQDKDLVKLLSAEQPRLKSWMDARDILDIFLLYPGFYATPEELIGFLKPLQPRLYSIASSQAVHPQEVHLTVAAVRYDRAGRLRKGVCSTFLAERVQPGGPVPVFAQLSNGFRLPADDSRPIIMVGPGTGVAPFRAFLQERRATGAKGQNWLFFGEQREQCDFYYKGEFESLAKDGYLHRLDTAFSRDQEKKFYVQHRMAEQARTLWQWLEEGAHFYVCGDAQRMAKDVDRQLLQICREQSGLSEDNAAEYVQRLKSDKRYQRDVY